MKGALVILVLAFGLAQVSFAQGATDPDFSGTWFDNSNSAAKITFTEKGDQIQVHEMDGDRVVADYTCSLNGAQCEFKEDGRPVKVTMYYNGSKLIEITERGKDVSKRRFSLGQDGKSMQVETIPLSSEGKTITQTYQKQANSPA